MAEQSFTNPKHTIETYDYIIIGAGSAGCVLANRLSADPSNRVLLVEAGGPERRNPFIHMPGGYAKLHRSKVDWGYRTEPQEHVDQREIYLPRGKVLGGSSSTNAMVYVRGNHEDYNDWANMGNRGWSYEEVLPVFKEMEANQDIHNEYHGHTGELNVEFAKRHRTPFATAFEQSCYETGFQKNMDYNGAEQQGAGPFQFTIKRGKRHSGARAFLLPVMRRKNLTVLTRTHTRRVLIEGDRAVGIATGNRRKSEQIFRAGREVILCAGSFGSPHLLMLSGVGAKAELEHFDIDCKHDLPGVGKNLQDHLIYAVSALSTEQVGQNHSTSTLGQLRGLFDYLVRRRGVFNLGPLESVAFGSTSASPDRVDYQFQFTATQIGDDYSTDMYDLRTFPREDGFTILPTLLRPKSRGYLRLKSADPFDYPAIQPNLLQEESDRRVLVEAGRKALEVLESRSFERYRKRTIMPPYRTSDDEWMQHIRRQVETVYHPVGTCKMGSDEAAVVDDRLRVHGIEGLRVADASIMPTIVSGNTNAAAYLIGGMAAKFILEK